MFIGVGIGLTSNKIAECTAIGMGIRLLLMTLLSTDGDYRLSFPVYGLWIVIFTIGIVLMIAGRVLYSFLIS